ncbi:hypothetical protein CLIB1423_08S04896 [[Candida] railenensis]|uniref:F-box domain-containing protein n=1 Tax=[Candida] railenensis TaxID=45579 RepID=A0A9P0QQN9_9ASCO|nr:hypothetical protein CLIB1423_08S04896 [[Candida] railenensis]
MSMYLNYPYSFDTPIGYTKNPLPKRSYFNHYVHEDKRRESPPPPVTGLTLDKLPREIRVRIANELSQLDSFNLLRTCRSLYSSTLPRLYQNIIIDQNYSQFNKEYNYHQFEKVDLELSLFSCSYINSPYNFKKFLKNYITLYKSFTLQLLQHRYVEFPSIKSFSCIDLPDELNIYDHGLNELLIEFVQVQPHLKELIWLGTGFEYKYLEYLPNCKSLVNLSLNLKYSSYITEKRQTALAAYNMPYPLKIQFPNLTNLEIQNFNSLFMLREILVNVLFSIENIGDQLTKIKLSRSDNHLNDSLLLYPYDSLIGPSLPFKSHELNTFDSIFANPKVRFNRLTSLVLHDFLIEPDEADLFMKCVNLENLTTLELSSVTEYQQSFDGVDLKTSFLLRIVSKLTNLKHLRIDYRESIVDSVPKFLRLLPQSSKLQSLDLTIRYNRSKLRTFRHETTLYEEYAQSILLNDRDWTLEKLSIDIKEENLYCGDINISLPLPPMFYDCLSRCKNLKSLRFSPSSAEIHNEILEMVQSLSKLEFLDVFGTKAGGAPHMGLEMVHPSIYDEWFKVQHVAMLYCKSNKNLKYIRVNKCVFEHLRNDISPRDGIDRWFNQKVKLGFE